MRDSYRERLYVGAEARAAARDRLIFNITDELLIIMEDNGVTKQELARRLGKSRSFVSQILSGRRNMTLGTFSDICFALKFEPKVLLSNMQSHDFELLDIDKAFYLPWVKQWELNQNPQKSFSQLVPVRLNIDTNISANDEKIVFDKAVSLK